MENFKKYFKINLLYDFLYPLIFCEYIFLFTYYYELNEFRNLDFNKKFNLLIVKRSINQINKNQNNLFLSNKIFIQKKIYNYWKIIYNQFLIIIEIFFYIKLIFVFEQKQILNSQSIHLIFVFLEDKFLYLNNLLNILIPYPSHFEILINIIYYYIKDIFTLHLLKIYLYKYYIIYLILSKKKFLYSYYIYEYEFIFFFFRNQFYHLQFIYYQKFIERSYYYIKYFIFHKVKIIYKKNIFKKYLLLNLECFNFNINYLRYKKNLIFILKETFFIMNKFKYYLIKLWQLNFYVWLKKKKIIYIYKLDNYLFNFKFMGYFFFSNKKLICIENNILENVFFIHINFKKINVLISIKKIINYFFKIKLCNIRGYPKSNYFWTNLANDIIINKFLCINRNFFNYYSGIVNKNILFKIKYIFKSSFIKTLSHKYKNTVHVFLKNLSYKLLIFSFIEEEKIIFLILLKYLLIGRIYIYNIWYLDIIINY
uniref:maturase K n=1 Tax=Sarcophyte sanguinea TaxID=1618143 RepID=UPI0026E22FDC|nr:maturase K [Sarcophyte sanguinea]WJE89110.1 maturase K [Sarcophyte sanguinea]WJE89129.1 maturase K [Sarcophyte sanguinea]